MRCDWIGRLRSPAGISFIEVLAALALFTVIAVGLTTSVVSNINLNNSSRTIAAATALVQDKIEQVRSIVPAVNTTPADLTTGNHADPSNPLTAAGAPNGTFTRTWSVTRVPQYLGGNIVGVRPALLQVAVTVNWSVPTTGAVTAVTYACSTPNCG